MTESQAETVGRAPITGIDHMRVGVRDLGVAHGVYTRLGFTLSPRGRHVGWGTENYTIVFGHDYLELLGIADPSQYIAELDAFLAHGEGLFSIRLGTDDADGLTQWLRDGGFEVEAPRDHGRIIETDDGEEVLQFRLVPLPGVLTPQLALAAFQHLTLDLLRKPDLLSHPNGAKAISEVTVAVDELEGIAEGYRKVFGDEAVSGELRRGLIRVDTGSADLLFLTRKTFPRRHYDVEVDKDMPLPRIAALTLKVADPNATALYLAGQNIGFEREPDGTVLVNGEDACGVLLEFVRDDE